MLRTCLVVVLLAMARIPAQATELPANLVALGAKAEFDGSGAMRRLDLSRSRVTDQDLAQVARLTELEALDLRLTSVGDSGVLLLRSLVRLRTLNLFRTAITDAGLSIVSDMPMLETLLVGGTKVTDLGMKQLGPLARLKKLSIFDTAVGDGAIPDLANLPRLEVLLLDKSRVTDAGRKELVARSPRLSFAEP